MSNNPGSRATATGLAIILLAVSAGVGFGGHGVLLGLVGVVIGANVIAVGVRGPAAFARLGALTLIPGSTVTATGLTIMLLAVSAGVGSGGHGVLLGLVGVLIGANVIAVGVCGPAPFVRLGALTLIPASTVTVTGLAITLLVVSAGVGSGDHGVLLGLMGVLIGANVIVVGVRRMGEEPATPTTPAAFSRRPGALTAFLRRNLTVVGLIMASSAVTAVAGGETGPVVCFTIFALLLLGLSFINIRVLGEY